MNLPGALVLAVSAEGYLEDPGAGQGHPRDHRPAAHRASRRRRLRGWCAGCPRASCCSPATPPTSGGTRPSSWPSATNWPRWSCGTSLPARTMWRSSRTSGVPAPDLPGSRLVTLAAAVVVAALLGNLLPPEPRLRLTPVPARAAGGLAGAAWDGAAARVVGRVRGAGRPRGVRIRPARARRARRRSPVPVRFVVSVRDGWTSGARGWGTRVRVLATRAGRQALRPTRGRWSSTSSAPVGLAQLPIPGTRWEGSGELIGDPRLPLKAGYLRVKTLLLLRRQPGGSPVDRLREAGVQALQESAGVDPTRLHAAGLAAALVLQRREGLQAGEVASMRRSGLVHLLSVSGPARGAGRGAGVGSAQPGGRASLGAALARDRGSGRILPARGRERSGSAGGDRRDRLPRGAPARAAPRAAAHGLGHRGGAGGAGAGSGPAARLRAVGVRDAGPGALDDAAGELPPRRFRSGSRRRSRSPWSPRRRRPRW